jgi:hypothetical protein
MSISGNADSNPIIPFEVGRYWEYTHQGPRPGSIEPKSIGGQRVQQVIESVGSDVEHRWIIEERFTQDPNIIARLQVRKDRVLTAIVVENEKAESLTLSYDNPVPYQFVDLPVGGSTKLHTTLITKPGEYKLPYSIEITRLDDETLDTPAGRFDDCRVYRSVSDSALDIKIAKIPFREQRQWWFSPGIGATVKEIYTRDPVKFLTWSQEGYTSTSTLSGYGIRKISDIQQAAAIRDGSVRPASEPEVRSNGSGKWIPIAIGLGIVLVVVRFKRKRHAV